MVVGQKPKKFKVSLRVLVRTRLLKAWNYYHWATWCREFESVTKTKLLGIISEEIALVCCKLQGLSINQIFPLCDSYILGSTKKEIRGHWSENNWSCRIDILPLSISLELIVLTFYYVFCFHLTFLIDNSLRYITLFFRTLSYIQEFYSFFLFIFFK